MVQHSDNLLPRLESTHKYNKGTKRLYSVGCNDHGYNKITDAENKLQTSFGSQIVGLLQIFSVQQCREYLSSPIVRFKPSLTIKY